jgi:hypothetical protein
MLTKFIYFMFFFLSIQALYANGQDSSDKKGLDINGHLLNEASLLQYYNKDSYTTDFTYAGRSVFRLNFLNTDRSFAKIEGSVDFSLFYGEYADLLKTSFLFNIRKLCLALYPEFADITLGRQIVNYGVGFLFSPIDVFSKVDFTDINYARLGSDIARIQIPLGELGGLDLTTTFSAVMTNVTSAVKLFGNIFESDLALIGIYHGDAKEWITGFTFKGDLEVGIHGELVEHFFESGTNNFFEGMLGIDYSFFDSKLILLLEYYYNEKAVDTNTVNIANYLSINKPFFNKHYLFFQCQYVIDEIRKAGVSAIYNPLDNALVLTAQYLQNIFQNANLTAFIRYNLNNLNGISFVRAPLFQYALQFEVLY